MMLMPRLMRLAGESMGAFCVMLNTDELGQLARSHAVVSLPTIKVYRHGKVVGTLHGAESERHAAPVHPQAARRQHRHAAKCPQRTRAGRHRQRRTPRRRSGVDRSAEYAHPARSRQAAGAAGPLHRPTTCCRRCRPKCATSCRNFASLPRTCPSCARARSTAAHRTGTGHRHQSRQPGGALPTERRATGCKQLRCRHATTAGDRPARPRLPSRCWPRGVACHVRSAGDDDERVLRYRALLQAGMH